MDEKILYAALSGLAAGTLGTLLSADGMICLSIVLGVVGLLFLGFYTGPSAAYGGGKSAFPTQQISETIVEMDSATRWRRKSQSEYLLGFLILVFALSAAAVPLLFFLMRR